jgi:SnoaL-like domain
MPESTSQSALTFQKISAIEVFYRAFNDRKPDLLDDACTPDWRGLPLSPGEASRPEGLKQIMLAFFSAFPDLRIAVHGITGSGGRARACQHHRYAHGRNLRPGANR